MAVSKPLEPAVVAAALAAFLDVLLPGDELFPPASAAGAHGLFSERLRAVRGAGAVFDLVHRLENVYPGFARRSEGERTSAVESLEREDPELFGWLVNTAYLSYYQSPVVVETIRRLGHDYNDAPQPRGYSMDPFDPARDLPARPRGHYLRTEEVSRVYLTGLDHLSDLLEGGDGGTKA